MRIKALLVVMAIIAIAAGFAHPVYAADRSSPGHHGGGKTGKSESSSPSSHLRPLFDNNDPYDSGCASNPYLVVTTKATTFTYIHTYQIQIRHSYLCGTDWIRLWETSGSGDCIYGLYGAPSEMFIFSRYNQQSVAGGALCDDAWTDMVPSTPGYTYGYIDNGSYILASVSA